MRYVSGIGARAPLDELLAFVSGCLTVKELRSAVDSFLNKAMLMIETREASKTRVVSIDIDRSGVTIWTGARLQDWPAFGSEDITAVLVQLSDLSEAA